MKAHSKKYYDVYLSENRWIFLKAYSIQDAVRRGISLVRRGKVQVGIGFNIHAVLYE